jgi:hypothetical protein
LASSADDPNEENKNQSTRTRIVVDCLFFFAASKEGLID